MPATRTNFPDPSPAPTRPAAQPIGAALAGAGIADIFDKGGTDKAAGGVDVGRLVHGTLSNGSRRSTGDR